MIVTSAVHEGRVEFSSGGRRLVGTVALPPGEGPFPGALLLPGSGPLDRDANHRRMRFDVSRQLAHALAWAGVASLRFDKRGVGESPGNWRQAGLFDNVDDAAAALEALGARPDVGEALFVVGHSEGAVLAAALAGRRQDLAGVVLLAGTARSGQEVLRWQAEKIAPTLPVVVRAILKVLRIDLAKKGAANQAKVRATTTDVARIGGARVNARWLREFMSHVPARDLERSRVPVLAITGQKDLQVPPEDLQEIARAAGGPVSTLLVPDLTHSLRRQSGQPRLGSYKKEVARPVDPEVLGVVVDWLCATSRIRVAVESPPKS